MAQLFKKNILKEKLENFEIPNFEEKLEIIKKWNDDYHHWTLKTDNETARDSGWTQDFLWTVLDYTRKPAENYTYNTEYVVSGQRPDFVLWYFDKEENLVVWELKDAKTSLDAPQKREWSLTPVQQAFKYKWWLRNTSFVIVSNFYEIRLYNDNHLDFEVWNLDDLLNPKNNYFNFRKFYFLLCKNNLIAKKWDSNTKNLLSNIRIREKEITKKFYQEYTILRKELFKDIIKNNPWFKKTELDFILNKTQKIIDRIIFIHFCEDLGLLPQGKLKEVIKYWEESLSTTWETLKNFFRAVDSGSEKLWIPDWYNWGLFHTDEQLNSLKVWDKICRKFVDLWEYDFADDLSVNILWHIFEQSISDIEELKDKIQKEEEPTLSKRKKDWVFYTPEYIVDYIVKNSVWKKIDDWEEQLKEKHKLTDKITDKNYTKRAITVYEELQQKVQNIKVLDPACGSWAFLVKVFDFLLDKNKEISNKLQDLSWSNALNMFSTDTYLKDILKNNIYWVDLNEESVEITKLSLWLKTAIKWKKLANLDQNIKCWNSLIDDPEIAWDKAFNWETEFSDIFDKWGFDVIVGNPPYVSIKKDDYKKYITSSCVDLYALFIELSYNLLKNNWALGFIIPDRHIVNTDYKTLRKLLLEKTSIKEIIPLWDWIFEDVNMPTSLLFFEKYINKNNIISVKENLLWEIIFFEQNWFLNNENYIFSIFTNQKWLKIIDKIERKWIKLSEFLDNARWVEIWKKSKILYEKNNFWYVEFLKWEDINKYYLKPSCFIKLWEDNINYKENSLYEKNSILIRKTWNWINATFKDKYMYFIQVIYSFSLKENEKRFNEKYILSLLNSAFYNFYYHSKFWDKWRKTFPHLTQDKILWLYVKNIPLLEQKPFIEKADFMLDKNKIMQEKIDKFLKRVWENFEIKKFSNKIKNFFELDFGDFVKELKKTKNKNWEKVSLSLKEQDDWEEYFEDYKKEILELKSEIEKCDKEIDEMVFDLYGLSEEERKVVLESN